MVASDTVIGIVGAVALLGLMGGVFAYEYYGHPGTTTGGGTNPPPGGNHNMTATSSVHFADQTPSPPTTTYSHEVRFNVTTGNHGIRGWLNWTVGAPDPGVNLVPRTPNLKVDLIGPDGSAVATGVSATQSGTSVSMPITADGAQVPGTYIFRISMTQPGPSEPLSLDGIIDYGMTMP
jgi:hypothetical protein